MKFYDWFEENNVNQMTNVRLYVLHKIINNVMTFNRVDIHETKKATHLVHLMLL